MKITKIIIMKTIIKLTKTIKIIAQLTIALMIWIILMT